MRLLWWRKALNVTEESQHPSLLCKVPSVCPYVCYSLLPLLLFLVVKLCFLHLSASVSLQFLRGSASIIWSDRADSQRSLCVLPASSWARSCGCSLTAAPAVNSPLSYHRLFALVHVTALVMWLLPAPVSELNRPPLEAVRPWSGGVHIKLHLTLSPLHAQLIANQSASSGLIMFNHLFSCDLCLLSLFFSLLLSSHCESFPEWDKLSHSAVRSDDWSPVFRLTMSTFFFVTTTLATLLHM